MRFVSARHGDSTFAGAVIDDHVVPLAGHAALGASTPTAVLRSPELLHDRAVPLADVALLPVVPNPGKIVCVGSNYHAHVEEMGRSVSAYPVLFTKFASSLIGPYDDIIAAPESEQVDYEAEIAVVIGTRGRRIEPGRELEHVAGYAVANDVSMRDFQYLTHQWLQGKAWDSATPLGPMLVTPDEVDIANLDIRLTLNGETMQESNTSLLIHDVPTIIRTLSVFMTLEPGDVILTGTPGGVGFKREPQVFLGDGDRVVVDVPGVGKIDNTVRRAV
jgi:acylpyruvate hydrolase